jgi:hypothetical protein
LVAVAAVLGLTEKAVMVEILVAVRVALTEGATVVIVSFLMAVLAVQAD